MSACLSQLPPNFHHPSPPPLARRASDEYSSFNPSNGNAEERVSSETVEPDPSKPGNRDFKKASHIHHQIRRLAKIPSLIAPSEPAACRLPNFLSLTSSYCITVHSVVLVLKLLRPCGLQFLCKKRTEPVLRFCRTSPLGSSSSYSQVNFLHVIESVSVRISSVSGHRNCSLLRSNIY